jgi:hypothetical protein
VALLVPSGSSVKADSRIFALNGLGRVGASIGVDEHPKGPFANMFCLTAESQLVSTSIITNARWGSIFRKLKVNLKVENSRGVLCFIPTKQPFLKFFKNPKNQS